MEFKDSFYLIGKFFDAHVAFPLDSVLGVFKLEDITPIPNNKNKYLLGVTNAKGHIVPVMDFNVGEKLDSTTLLVIFETNSGKRGAAFEKLEEVRLFSKEDLEKVKINSETARFYHLVIDSKEFIIMDPEISIDMYEIADIIISQTSKAS